MGGGSLSALLLDTHAWAWLLNRSARLSSRATQSVQTASEIFLSPISFFEIGQKVRLGKWPEMEPFSGRLPALLDEQGGKVAALTVGICLRAGLMDWPHRDPFDRLIAATAITASLDLVSADAIFDSLAGVPGWRGRIW